LLNKEISDSRPSSVLFPSYISAMAERIDSFIICNSYRVIRTVIGNKNLKRNINKESLFMQITDKFHTTIVVSGDED
jgi:hypothetical protein